MRNKKIILVDDDKDFLTLLELVFKRDEFEVRTALSSQELFEALKTFKPDAIILDMIMPKIGGEEICQKIREIPDYDDIKLFFLSVVVLPEDKLASIKNKYHISEYFYKPTKIDELPSRVIGSLHGSQK